ncbi:hypothetical protein ACFL59_04615, partial [Planctomycetota bacterium]
MESFAHEVLNSLSKLLPGQGWVGKLMSAAIALGILIALLVLVYKFAGPYLPFGKKKKGKPLRKPGLSSRALLGIWKEFLRQIPREFRRAITGYQPFVVMGPAGSGKTTLITRLTDWKGQAAKFYSSYATREELQIYLGTRALVQEVPAALLDDLTQGARTALIKLWRPLFRKREPMVVICLKGPALSSQDPETIRHQAQLLRGKINVISRFRQGPVKTRVVLTHMDEVEGYQEFSEFLEQQGIPLVVDPGTGGTRAGVQQCLEAYEQYLPLALTSLSADKYRRVLTFLEKTSGFFSSTDLFLRTLTEKEPLSDEPEISQLYLTSELSHGSTRVANPFDVVWQGRLLARHRPPKTRVHRLVPVGVCAIAVTAMATSFLVQRGHWLSAKRALAQFEQSSQPAKADAFERALAALIPPQETTLAGILVPHFFSATEVELRSEFVRIIREKHILPACQEALRKATLHEKMLYLYALLYASGDNELGDRVLKRTNIWTAGLPVPRHLVRLYVEHSKESWPVAAPLPDEPLKAVTSLSNDIQPWLAYFMELEETLDKPFLTASRLKKLQKTATQLRSSMEHVIRNEFVRVTYTQLKHRTALDGRDVERVFGSYVEGLKVPQWMIFYQKQLQGLLDLIRSARLEVPSARDMTLPELSTHLESQAVLPKDEATYQVALLRKDFAIEARRWHSLVANSRMRVLIHSYVAANKISRGRAFFSDGSE